MSGCTGGPPKELTGLWSSSAEACAAGLGVTFRGDSVRARFAQDEFVLLAAPRYSVKAAPTATLVRIDYALPRASGVAEASLGRGVLELERTPDGRLSALGGRFIDLRTGSTRVALKPGALERAFTLASCPKRKA